MKRWNTSWACVWLVAGMACGGRAEGGPTDSEGTPAATDDVDIDIPASAPSASAPGGSTGPATPALPASPSPSAPPAPPAAPPAAEPPPPLAQAADASALERRAAEQLLDLYCGECHGSQARERGKVQGNIGDIDSLEQLVVQGQVIPLNASASPVYQAIANDSMPPPGVFPRPDKAVLDLLRDVIEPDRFWSNESEGPDVIADRLPETDPLPQ